MQLIRHQRWQREQDRRIQRSRSWWRRRWQRLRHSEVSWAAFCSAGIWLIAIAITALAWVALVGLLLLLGDAR